VKRDTIVLLLALEDDAAALPAAVAPYEAVLLGPREWSVDARLRPDRVRSTLARLLEGDLELGSLERLPLPSRGDGRRSHRRALFRVRGVDPATGAPRRLDVVAVGTGLGYFGAHQLAIASALGAFAPRLLGFDDGVLYREWLPAQRRLTADSDELPAAVASYVAARRQALRVDRDMSTVMRGDRPVWEVAALILTRGFTPVAPVMRILLVNRVVTRLLSVAQPSVLDGSMTPDHWFAGEQDGSVVKVSLGERSFWRLGLGCYDASFDLAGVATCSPHGELGDRVREAWLAETGEEIEPERWLLYELAHLWGALRDDPNREADVLHASARAAARYFARSFFEDLTTSPAGPFCALDIDGVLETQQLGFPTLTRASATALRALVAHGYRPVLVTGRGVEEVRDRCGIYGLQGGVAEYGSAIWVERSKRATGLLDDEATAALSRLRAVLQAREGVRLDPAFSYAIRAYRADINGRRSPLGAEEAAECLATSRGEHAVRTIPGENQTDFVSAVLDKGTGLQALIGALATDHGFDGADASAVALAVGDTASDAPMLALAQAAFVPAHAAPAATKTGARRVRRPYQAGLHLAVGELLGHPPGGCPRCQVPPPTPAGDLLLDLLSAPESGPRGLPLRAVRLVRKLR
jgi:hydroxymethylpyrimidine pyrophosphatase-like HAD family hydrolase